MDCKVPEYLGAPGVGHDGDDLHALDDYYFCSDQLLLCGGGEGSSGVDGEPSLTNLPDPPPPPPSSPVPTYYAGKDTPSEAEMASWLCQVFEQEPRGAAATMNQSEGGNAVPRCTVPSGVAASGEVECRRGPASSGRRGLSCSGKVAEQRRRNKINGKLRTLQQMVPWCSKVKTDTASTLDEVIKYVKSLQHQLQVMSANGFAVPPPILPLGVMPPPWMQLPAGDSLGVGGQAPVMFPRFPVFPTVYACPHTGTPPPLSAPYTRRHPVEPGSGILAAGSSSLLLEGPRHDQPQPTATETRNDVRAARSL